MAFTVKYRGLDVHCESIADLNTLAEQTESARAKEVRKVRREANRAAAPSNRSPLFEDRSVRGLIHELKSQQKTLVKAVSEGEKTDTELRALLDLDGNKALAGVLSGISKAAKRLGVDVVLIDKKSTRAGNGDREYRYWIKPEAAEEVERALANGHA